MPENDCRLRVKLPSGAELELSGPREFVEGERKDILAKLEPKGGAAASPPEAAPRTPDLPRMDWTQLAERQGADLMLRARLEGAPLEAALVLILASDKLLNQPRPNATMLAKWIRGSGYAVDRIDRVLAAAVREGDILAAGAKRSRRYELSPAGQSKALRAAEKLLRAVTKPAL